MDSKPHNKDSNPFLNSYMIALPFAEPDQINSLMQACSELGIPSNFIQGTPDLLNKASTISRINNLDPKILLPRPARTLNHKTMREFFLGKRICVTGAAGSIGTELANQIGAMMPAELIVIDRAESPLFFLEADLRAKFPDLYITALVSDITDHAEILDILLKHEPQILFHAAAHKHVPLMERTPSQAIKNNVHGTYTVAQCAQKANVDTFVLVSTDKAVNPTSVMGATKRLAELLILEMNLAGNTNFSAVRFGNVLGSAGSVVPIFKQQIMLGGPITVTHSEATRYFMSVSEAAGLILQAGAIGNGGEIFALDMGDPVRIVAIAETMITLSGLRPHEDIDIIFTGLRPGEKLCEELAIAGEEFETTEHPGLLILKNNPAPQIISTDVEDFLKSLSTLDQIGIKTRLRNLVPEYTPDIPKSRS